MRNRRKAREAAMQVLYQCDTLSDWSKASVDLYFEVFQKISDAQTENEKACYDFCRQLIDGVVVHLALIDSAVESASTNWPVARMGRVDRNIIRIACFELGFVQDVPVNVCINEAVELAKQFCGDDSPMFINGILDKLSKALPGRGNEFPAALARREKAIAA